MTNWNNRGLSLIELLVAVALTSLLTLGGISSFSKFNDQQKLKAAADDFVTNFRLIQKRVNANEKGSCTSNTYTHIIERQGTGYKFRIMCPDHLGTNLKTIDTYSFLHGVTLQGQSLMYSHGKHIEILPLNRGISTSQVIQLQLSSCSIQITVGTGGTITVGDVTGC